MKVEKIGSLEELEKWKDVWDEFLLKTSQNSPFLTHEWFFSWWKSFAGENSLEILIFKKNKEDIVGIAPLMKRRRGLYFIANHEVTDYCDFITTDEERSDFFCYLIEYIKTSYPGLETVELINIPFSSPTLTFLQKESLNLGVLFKSHISEVAPFLPLTSTYQGYLDLLDRKKRHELKRKTKKTEILNEMKVQKITDPLELQKYIKKFITLHQNSSPSKTNFWKKKGMLEFFHELTSRFSQKQWVELEILWCRDKAVAYLLNFLYLNRLYFYNSAFDREFSKYNPGLFLFHHCIKQAIEEGREKVDFLRGDEKYKYDLGAQESNIFNIVLNFKVNL